MGNKLSVVMYHYTRDFTKSEYPKIKGLDIKDFREQLEFFKENFNVVTMEQVIDCWNSGKELPSNALILTFDDGYIDNFNVAFPILQEFGFQGSFFIPGKTFTENKLLDVNKIHYVLASANNIKEVMDDLIQELNKARYKGHDLPSNQALIDKYAVSSRFDDKETIFVKRVLQTAIPEYLRNEITSSLFEKYVSVSEEEFSKNLYMNRDQIKLMKNKGMFIGLHGYDHYWLGELSELEMKNDIDKMLNVMEEFIDIDSWVLNYPYGNYSDEVISYINKKGCKLGMTTEVGLADSRLHNKFKIPRFDCNDFPPKSTNYKKGI